MTGDGRERIVLPVPPANVVPLRPRVTIGGSSAAAACGIDPHRSRVMLWAELTGRVERPASEAMRWGTLLQPVILDELREQGHDAYAWRQDDSDAVRDPERPWLVGHPDGYVRPSTLLEIKTANAWAKWTDRAPLAYEAQVQTYLHLTGLDHGLLAVLIGGQRLEVREVERSEPAIALMLELMDEFMGYVERDEPPPPDASSSSRDALAALYPEHAPECVVRFTHEQMVTVRELQARRSQLAVVKSQADGLENSVRAWMGDAEAAVGPHDEPVASWRSYDERRVSTEKLKAEFPAAYEACAATNRRRRFTLA